MQQKRDTFWGDLITDIFVGAFWTAFFIGMIVGIFISPPGFAFVIAGLMGVVIALLMILRAINKK